MHDPLGNETFCRAQVGHGPGAGKIDHRRSPVTDGNLDVASTVDVGVSNRDVVRQDRELVATLPPDHGTEGIVYRNRFGDVVGKVDRHVPRADFQPPAGAIGAQPAGKPANARETSVRGNAGTLEIRGNGIPWCVRVEFRQGCRQVADDSVYRQPGQRRALRFRDQRQQGVEYGQVQVVGDQVQRDQLAVRIGFGLQPVSRSWPGITVRLDPELIGREQPPLLILAKVDSAGDTAKSRVSELDVDEIERRGCAPDRAGGNGQRQLDVAATRAEVESGVAHEGGYAGQVQPADVEGCEPFAVLR